MEECAGYDSDETVGGWVENRRDSRPSPDLLLGDVQPDFVSELDALSARALPLLATSSFQSQPRLTQPAQSQPRSSQPAQSQPRSSQFPAPTSNTSKPASGAGSNKRKKSAASATSSGIANRQASIVTLLKKLGDQSKLPTVWCLLKAYDYVELSTLAQYQGLELSTSASKKELADLVAAQFTSGRFSQELSTAYAAGAPAHPPSTSTSSSSSSSSSIKMVVDATSTVGGASGKAKVNNTPYHTLATGSWVPLASDDVTGHLLLQGCEDYNDNDNESNALPLSGDGVVFLSTNRASWESCSKACEALLEYDNVCYGALQLAAAMDRAPPSSVHQPRDGGDEKRRHEKGILALREALTSLKSGMPDPIGSGSEPVPEKRNAQTQTTHAVLVPKEQEPRGNVQLHAALKVCRFDGDQLGLVLKQVRGPAGLRTVLQSVKNEIVDTSVKLLLTTGDELVSANGVVVGGLSFAEQMDLLRSAVRPLLLAFASTN